MTLLHKRIRRVDKRVKGYLIQDRLDSLIQKAEVMDFEAIPLEQLKGDIARSGHIVEQSLAIDPEGRRFFFTNKDGDHLYAEFGTKSENYRVNRISHQSRISKEYPVMKNIPGAIIEDEKILGGKVVTAHDEWGYDEEKGKEKKGKRKDEEAPGLIPSGTPGVKPSENDRGYSMDQAVDVTNKATHLIRELRNFATEGEEEDHK